MEFAWAAKFFESPKANIAFAVFLGFEAQFLAIFVCAAPHQPPENWTALRRHRGRFRRAGCGFCLLGYPALGRRPGFLFTFAFLAEAGLLGSGASARRDRSRCSPRRRRQSSSSSSACWTASLSERALLWWGLGGYVVFALLHAGFAFWPKRMRRRVERRGVAKLRCRCSRSCSFASASGKNETSSAVWLCVLVLDFIAIARGLRAAFSCRDRCCARSSLSSPRPLDY